VAAKLSDFSLDLKTVNFLKQIPFSERFTELSTHKLSPLGDES